MSKNNKRTCLWWGLALTVASVLAVSGAVAGDEEEPEFTDSFAVADCTWSSVGHNRFFSLEPGYTIVLEGEEDGEEIVQEIVVTDETRLVVFADRSGEVVMVDTRIVEERESEDDELVEVSANFYARCIETNDIFYFGEEVDDYEDGVIVSHEGAWLAGIDGARPGIIMPGTFLLGARYFQEHRKSPGPRHR